ncbi:glycosyltransferase family 2 protein [Chitinophagaceae bacterium LB-8]|uniref:Glycosyltransferase family 2 protein n=1 Tax=Paraflavisolibacter caeni TaxID=2982496 RepID=A0A9X2XRP9_9BACT|nr:glycosyltransferase family 2 protein [Paraflavisolibacter caeni]MCU7547504.1 glycosyltransferase family 2 protein [Paraflavisolibacter caeni]
MISVIILTKNEAINLPACLQSVAWSDDVHVLDSGSTDETIEIAYNHGVSVSSNPFESFAKQRNYALDHLPVRYEWILFLDADEIVNEQFRIALFEAVSNARENVAGFYCCWKMMLEGKWLKHCDNFPKWQFRLLRKGRAKFTDFGHGQKEESVIGVINYIKVPYLHYCFSKGWSNWMERHNIYSSHEAMARLYNCPSFKNIFSRHGSVRNAALRCWASRLPGWPILRFIQAYFLNLGFLEGVPGFIYCANVSYYEFLIQIKMREQRNR